MPRTGRVPVTALCVSAELYSSDYTLLCVSAAVSPPALEDVVHPAGSARPGVATSLVPALPQHRRRRERGIHVQGELDESGGEWCYRR